MNERDAVYVAHILDAAKRALAYTRDLTEDQFRERQIVQDASIRQLEVIGEAAKLVSSETRARYPQIPWRVMAGMRDRLIHGYFGVDLSAVWKTCTSDVPNLIKQLDKVRDA
ncbi:MAG: DUF86 domain-containing protein [Spirochaetota bacterium]